MMNAEAREALTHLVQRYHSALPKKAKDLEVAYALAKEEGWSDNALKHFRTLVHRLAGSAASYGFAELGEWARELDQGLVYITDHADADIEGLIPSRFSALMAGIQATIDRPPPGDPSSPAAPDTTTTIDRPVIMVVDDDDSLVQVLCRQLLSLGFDAHGFTNPAQAIESAPSVRPAAVVMDLQFDEGEQYGFAVTEAIIDRLRYKPGVVYMSVDANMEARRAALAAGTDAVFSKPIQLLALTRMLEQFVNGPEQMPERVAIIDDDQQISDFYDSVLRGSDMETLVINDASAAIEPLVEFRPDLILMDVQMPELDGIELTGVLRQHESLFMVPVVFLSSVSDPVMQRATMRVGGDAFVGKAEDPEFLVHVVRDRVQRFRRVSTSLRTDTLTRVLNRAALLERLNFELQRAQRDSQALSVIVFDIDGFGAFNLDNGRMAGDAALQGMTKAIRTRLRSVDTVGRYGSDEIMVIMPATKRASAEAVVRELVDRIASLPIQSGDQTHNITLSAGVIESRLDRHDSTHFAAHQLLQAIDNTMVSVKREGPGSVQSAVHWLKREAENDAIPVSSEYTG